MELALFGKDGTRSSSVDSRERAIHGTTDWAEQQLVIDVPPDATAIAGTTLLFGKGEVWCDATRLEAVGSDVARTENRPWKPYSFFVANYTAVPDAQVMHDGHAAICIASTAEATTKQWISYNR